MIIETTSTTTIASSATDRRFSTPRSATASNRPGASMNLAEKLEVAQALVDLGVDVIEAGFPIASPGDFEAVRAIAANSPRRGDLRAGPLPRRRHRPRLGSRAARRTAADPRLPGHQRHPSRVQTQDGQGGDHQAGRGGRAAGPSATARTSSSRPKTPPRTETDFLCQVVEAAIAAGATTVNIPDTVGYATPDAHAPRHPHASQPRAEHRQGRDQRPLPQRSGPGRGQQPGRRRGRRAPGGMHDQRHRRTGRQLLAGRNRHGPAHPARLLPRRHTRIDTPRLVPTSRLVSNITGMQVQRNKAIVGENAFAHEAGIHQDGMLKERTTYEIMRPEDVGFATTDLVLGKHSGRAALADRAKALGYNLTGEQLDTVFDAVQGPGRQEEGNLRRRHRRPDRAADPRRRASTGRSIRTRSICGTGQVPEVTLHARARRREVHAPRWPRATARSTRSSWPSSSSPASTVDCTRFQRPQRHRGQGRPGRSDRGGRARTARFTAAAASRPTASRPAPRRF